MVVPFALALVAVSDGWAPLRRLDLNVANRLNTQAVAHPGLVTFLQAVSNVFSPTTFEVLAVVVALVLWLRKVAAARAVAGADRGAQRPRSTTWSRAPSAGRGRLRPPGRDADQLQLSLRPRPRLRRRGRRAPARLLPSLSRAWRRPAIAARASCIVLLVGYARVGLGVHYVSDVVGGWILGAAWLAAMTAAFKAWRHDLRKPDRPLDGRPRARRP